MLKLFLLSLMLALSTTTLAAKPLKFHKQSLNLLQQLSGKTGLPLRETNRYLDFNHTMHLRAQETYKNYPIWGANVVIHLPHADQSWMSKPFALVTSFAHQGSMNGFLYQDLERDLQDAAPLVFERAQAEKALSQAIAKTGEGLPVSDKQAQLLIYVDKNLKAHWAYFLQFMTHPAHGLPAKPTTIVDAQSFQVYRHWDNLQTDAFLTEASGGGFGGNRKTGRLSYDGTHLPALTIKRNTLLRTCYLKNREVIVKDANQDDALEQFACAAPDPEHNNIFWNGYLDAVNGAYSPSNDALFMGKIIKDMYQQWYGVPVLVTRRGKPMTLVMRVHEEMDNAYWDGHQMTFGDGITMFYPLVSLGVSAHEVSHGFTEQHSNLIYDEQSGGLNESFSDMAAQAAEFYVYGKSSWQIGGEILKAEDQVLRSIEHPALDCQWHRKGQDCSIERISDYHEELDVHFSSGIFNRFFYLLATTPGWDTQKAFNVMVQANSYYWIPWTNFEDAACAVMDANEDYHYPSFAVANAFAEVGINTELC